MGYIYPTSRFYNAQNAFVMLYDMILQEGTDRDNNTKALFNFGFVLENPLDRDINVEWRSWSKKYAEREWDWYVSKNRSVKTLQKFAPIWKEMHSGDFIVNSNYGYQWSRENQLEKTIEQLRQDRSTRQACITIFDGKEKDQFGFDAPCTLNVCFQIVENVLNMTVTMRSNDLWYGFCNDQYCFSKLQEQVAYVLGIKVGIYYHFVMDLHLYAKHFTSKRDFYDTNNGH